MNDVLIVLGLAGVFFGAMLFRGIFGYLKNQKLSLDDLKFSWKTFVSGSLRPIALTLATGGLATMVLIFLQLLTKAGLQVEGLDQISIQNFELGLAIADIGAIGYAMKEALLCFGLSDKQVAQIRETVASLDESEQMGIDIDLQKGELIAVADKVTPKQILVDKQTNTQASKENGEAEIGQGEFVNPLSRRLPDGDDDYGKGWQCTKYAWYLGSGICMNYAPHPDYGPCNGRDMVNYLIEKLGWVRCGKQNGAIFSYDTSSYGHTGMVVDAANNIVNDANWSPLSVGTHYINLEAVGATYCCPPEMIIPEPTPIPVPEPTPEPRKTNEEIADEVIRGEWGNNPERQQRLEAAGYDYGAIQAIVDARLNGGNNDNTFHVGDVVIPTILVDYNGTPLVQFDDVYTISELDGDRAVLTARGQVWAAYNTRNLRKV